MIKITKWTLTGGPGHMLGTQWAPAGRVSLLEASQHDLASAIICEEGGEEGLAEICRLYLSLLRRGGWSPTQSKGWALCAYESAIKILDEYKEGP